jgi:4-amino-4-deoxy-L-arabinose transferase-like glycosyltransferase
VHAALAAVHLYFLHRSPLLRYLTVDLLGYDRWARAIAGGDWLGQGVFYQDPLYPYLMAIVYALTGPEVVHILVVQIAASCATVLVVRRLGERLFGPATGTIAAWAMALYAPAIYYSGKPEKACLSALGLALLFAAVLRLLERTSLAGWCGAGALLGAVALMRANVLALVPALLAGLAFGPFAPKGRARLAAAGALVAGVVLALGPVLVRNVLVGGDWVLTTSQAGANLYIGNNPDNRKGSYMVLPFVRPAPEFEREDFHRHAEMASGRTLRPSEASAYYVREVVRWGLRDPAAFLRLQGVKTRAFLHAYEIPDNWSLEFVSRFSPVLRLPLLRYGIVVPLAVLGALLLLRRGAPPAVHWFLLLTFLYTASTLAFFIFSRYRYPIVFALVLLAAQGAVELARLLRERRWAPAAGGAAVVALVALFVHGEPPIDTAGDLSHRFYNLAASHLLDGRPAEARLIARRAIEIDPQNGLALLLLSRAAAEAGDPERARTLLALARRARPGDETIGVQWAWSESRHSGYEAAQTFVAAWLRHRESYLLRRAGIEIALLSGRFEDAARALRELQQRYPEDPWGREIEARLTSRAGRH